MCVFFIELGTFQVDLSPALCMGSIVQRQVRSPIIPNTTKKNWCHLANSSYQRIQRTPSYEFTVFMSLSPAVSTVIDADTQQPASVISSQYVKAQDQDIPLITDCMSVRTLRMKRQQHQLSTVLPYRQWGNTIQAGKRTIHTHMGIRTFLG